MSTEADDQNIERRVDEAVESKLVYESNKKHSEPWQSGARGSLCNADVRPVAAELLEKSVLVGKKRYAVHNGMPYCAHEHQAGRWHGHPVGWKEVPPKLLLQWKKEKLVTKRQIDSYWN